MGCVRSPDRAEGGECCGVPDSAEQVRSLPRSGPLTSPSTGKVVELHAHAHSPQVLELVKRATVGNS